MMKKTTKVLLALLPLLFGCVALHTHADEVKTRTLSFRSVSSSVPDGYYKVGNTMIYAGIKYHQFFSDYSSYAIDLYGQFGDQYLGSTYNDYGYKAAFQVDGYDAVALNCNSGTESHGVVATASYMPYGEFVRICYSLTNGNDVPVTVSVGAYADVMIGDVDRAPIEKRLDHAGDVYGLTMKRSTTVGDAAFGVIFGANLIGVTKADDYWFGYYRQNYSYSAMVGNYTAGSNWMEENGSYDSGMGWCWKNREIQPGETMEFAYLIGVGDLNFSYAEFEVVPTNLEVWNELDEVHNFNVNGVYVSPLGHSGVMYYQVDDSDEWVEINGTVLSGSNFSLPISVLFHEGVATHELRFRIIDEVGNETYLGSVSWTDVASHPVSGAFEPRVYNGQEQTYSDLTYEMDDSHWVTYYRDNIYPGTGYFVTEGLYPYSIGRVEYPFTIDKAACVYEVILPDAQITYDAQGHGATVIVPEGSGEVTVTYVNISTGATTTTAPVQPGLYEVYVEIGEGEYYYGIDRTLAGEFEIVNDPTAVEEITIVNNDDAVIYNMQGARVKTLQQGLYIINGKKVLVK